MIGRTVSHYRILDRLGEGGMGVVYRARDTRLERDVALKFIRPDLLRAGADRERFVREARLLASLDHPNICTLHEIDEFDGGLFMAMTLVEGKNLHELVAGGPLEVARALDIARQVAGGLHAAHERGIVHRDIKSGNVMLTGDGRVKILDFGLARRADATLLTREGMVLGTIGYMSPEQATGVVVDHRTDIWAVGVLLHELITGDLPFRAAYDPAVVYLIINQPAPPMSRSRPDVPDAVQALVDRALAKAPEDRFASAAELISAINAAGSGGPAVPAPVAAAPVPAPAAAIPSTVAVLDFTNITRNPDDDWLSSGIAESITVDLKRVGSLRVVSRDQVSRVVGDAGATADAAAAGARVGVARVIWGGYQRAGDTIRITAHASDVAGGEVLRSIKVDGRMDDIFALQDRIVMGLADAMSAQVSTDERSRIRQAETRTPRAYELAARGRLLFARGAVKHFDEARDFFLRALEIDPSYALAHSGLGSIHMWSYIARENPDDLREGIAHLEKAIEIDPGLGDAYVWLTYFRLRERNIAAAIDTGRRAIALEERNFWAHYFLGISLTFENAAGYDEASVRAGVLELRRASELAPDFEAALLMRGWLYKLHAQYDAARALIDRSVEIEAGTGQLRFVGALAARATFWLHTGRLDEAESGFAQSAAALAGAAHAYTPLFVAFTHCGLGDIAILRDRADEAVDAFQRALDAADAAPRTLGIGYAAIRARAGFARAFFLLGMTREAREDMARAEQMLGGDPGYSMAWTFGSCMAEARYDVALARLRMHDLDGAIAHLAEAVRMGWREWPRLAVDRWAETAGERADFAALAEAARSLEPLP
jgi:serine/threonine protein kinase/tetratricopeptide (TPR) repeat protein